MLCKRRARSYNITSWRKACEATPVRIGRIAIPLNDDVFVAPLEAEQDEEDTELPEAADENSTLPLEDERTRSSVGPPEAEASFEGDDVRMLEAVDDSTVVLESR